MFNFNVDFDLKAEVKKYRAASIINNPLESPSFSFSRKYNVDYMNERADILDRANKSGKLEKFMEGLWKAYKNDEKKFHSDPRKCSPEDDRHNPKWMMGFDKDVRSPVDMTFKNSDFSDCMQHYEEMKEVASNPLLQREIPEATHIEWVKLFLKNSSAISNHGHEDEKNKATILPAEVSPELTKAGVRLSKLLSSNALPTSKPRL